jgi:hypothetical protein
MALELNKFSERANGSGFLRLKRLASALLPTPRSPLDKDRDDPLTEMIAKKIIKIAQTGLHDAAQLSALAITQLRIR